LRNREANWHLTNEAQKLSSLVQHELYSSLSESPSPKAWTKLAKTYQAWTTLCTGKER